MLNQFVYHLPMARGYRNWSKVKLEMVNNLLAVRLFQYQWFGHKVLVMCKNESVVSVTS